jgi:hypothetical protein
MDASADRFLDLINQLEDFTRSISPDGAVRVRQYDGAVALRHTHCSSMGSSGWTSADVMLLG